MMFTEYRYKLQVSFFEVICNIVNIQKNCSPFLQRASNSKLGTIQYGRRFYDKSNTMPNYYCASNGQ